MYCLSPKAGGLYAPILRLPLSPCRHASSRKLLPQATTGKRRSTHARTSTLGHLPCYASTLSVLPKLVQSRRGCCVTIGAGYPSLTRRRQRMLRQLRCLGAARPPALDCTACPLIMHWLPLSRGREKRFRAGIPLVYQGLPGRNRLLGPGGEGECRTAIPPPRRGDLPFTATPPLVPPPIRRLSHVRHRPSLRPYRLFPQSKIHPPHPVTIALSPR